MELKDFVKNTLLDIVNGVKEAQIENQSGSMIVPQENHPNSGRTETVHFDVAIEASNKNSEGGKAGVSVAGFLSGGVAGETMSGESRVSRVQFDLRVRFLNGESVLHNQ